MTDCKEPLHDHHDGCPSCTVIPELTDEQCEMLRQVEEEERMINPLNTYVEAGIKAAEARNHGDEACAKFHADWFRRAKALETDENRVKAYEAYQHGYQQARLVPKFTPFR